MYEITYIEVGQTETMREADAIKLFGRIEWREIKAGYLPHIVAIKVE